MNLLDLAPQAGLQPKWAAGTKGGEYHSACPECGGKDRFSIHPNNPSDRCLGTYVCRYGCMGGDTLSFAIDVLGWECTDAFTAIEHTEPVDRKAFKYTPTPTECELPSALWIKQATSLVEAYHPLLLDRKDILRWLEERGLPLEAVKKYKLGYSPVYHRLEKKFFRTDKDVHISKGIIIPYMVDGEVRRIKIRRDEWTPEDSFSKYVGVYGGQKSMSLYPGSTKRMIAVESELDGLAVDYLSNGRLHVVATGSNTRRPDTVTHDVASDCTLIAVAYDNDDEGRKMLYRWKEFYDSAVKYPVGKGKDVGEAYEQGWDVKSWVEKLLL
jgi:hypothetical protein